MTVAPSVSELVHHLKRCPDEFLEMPYKGGRGKVHTEALVNDLLRSLNSEPCIPRRFELKVENTPIETLELIQVVCWLLSHPFFAKIDNGWFSKDFIKRISGLAPLVKTNLWVSDEERAEELARFVFQYCGYVPEGETREEALDRYESVNTVQRLKVIEETRAAMERAREIRRKMAEKKAREAANVYGRE